jgi:hypothetical protein
MEFSKLVDVQRHLALSPSHAVEPPFTINNACAYRKRKIADLTARIG